MRLVFVHGACVRDGWWWWHRMTGLLEERGVSSVAPALPSCGETGVPGGAGGPGLTEDVAAVRQVLQDSDEPTIVVAHSYGGIVTAEAAADVRSVRHLLLISSYLPEVGQSLSEFGDGTPAPFLDVDLDAGDVRGSPRAARGHIPAGLRRRRPGRGGRSSRRSECAGDRAAGRSGCLAPRSLDVPRVHPGRGHPCPVAARVRTPGRPCRRARRGPSPVPVSARRGPRSPAEPVRRPRRDSPPRSPGRKDNDAPGAALGVCRNAIRARVRVGARDFRSVRAAWRALLLIRARRRNRARLPPLPRADGGRRTSSERESGRPVLSVCWARMLA